MKVHREERIWNQRDRIKQTGWGRTGSWSGASVTDLLSWKGGSHQFWSVHHFLHVRSSAPSLGCAGRPRPLWLHLEWIFSLGFWFTFLFSEASSKSFSVIVCSINFSPLLLNAYFLSQTYFVYHGHKKFC